MTKLYLIGSLRNPEIPAIGKEIRELGINVFDDWFAGGYEADDKWKLYEEARGRNYKEALNGFIADHIFSFDLEHLDSADVGVLVAPAGKSCHLELGYLIGQDKPSYILLDTPDRWDIMYRFATEVFFNKEEMIYVLKTIT